MPPTQPTTFPQHPRKFFLQHGTAEKVSFSLAAPGGHHVRAIAALELNVEHLVEALLNDVCSGNGEAKEKKIENKINKRSLHRQLGKLKPHTAPTSFFPLDVNNMLRDSKIQILSHQPERAAPQKQQKQEVEMIPCSGYRRMLGVNEEEVINTSVEHRQRTKNVSYAYFRTNAYTK